MTHSHPALYNHVRRLLRRRLYALLPGPLISPPLFPLGSLPPPQPPDGLTLGLPLSYSVNFPSPTCPGSQCTHLSVVVFRCGLPAVINDRVPFIHCLMSYYYDFVHLPPAQQVFATNRSEVLCPFRSEKRIQEYTIDSLVLSLCFSTSEVIRRSGSHPPQHSILWCRL